MEFLGITYALIGVTANSLRDLVSKKLAVKVNSFLSAWATYIFSLPYYLFLLIPFILAGKETITLTASFLSFILLRSSTDVIGESLKMKALAKGELSSVSAFLTFTPIFTMIISYFFLQERISQIGLIGIFLAVMGSFLVVYQKGQKKVQWQPVVMAIAASGFFGLNSIYDKLAVKEGTPIFTAFAISIIGSIFLLIPNLLLKNRIKDFQKANKYFLVRGLFEAIYMIFKMLALQYLSATYLTVLIKSGVLISVFNGKVFLKEKNFKQKIMGTIILIVGLVLLILFGKSS